MRATPLPTKTSSDIGTLPDRSPFDKTAQHAAKRDAILSEASRLFNSKGARATTLADVAATLVRSGGGAPLFEKLEGSDWPIFASGVANQKGDLIM